jgi:thioredoxin reductase (NADPH)
MSARSIYDVAVIGAGGAGQMALLRAVLNHLNTVVFLGDADTTRRSRAAWVADVDNIPGFFAKKRPITTTTRETIRFIEEDESLAPFLTKLKRRVTSIRKTDEGFELFAGEERYRARFVVLCTGTTDVQPEIGGSIEPLFPFANRGDLLYCVRCDGHKTAGKPCAVIGHGVTAGNIAVLLKERYDLPEVHLLTHGKPFEADERLSGSIRHYGIQVHTAEIRELLGDARRGLQGFRVGERFIEVPYAVVAMGSIVHNDLARELGAELGEDDHIVTDARGETSVDGFYAAGDLVKGKKKQVYTSWDMAVDAVDAIDSRIRKLKREGAY